MQVVCPASVCTTTVETKKGDDAMYLALWLYTVVLFDEYGRFLQVTSIVARSFEEALRYSTALCSGPTLVY